jgi:hypothetical protein
MIRAFTVDAIDSGTTNFRRTATDRRTRPTLSACRFLETATVVVARLIRSTSNALRVQLATPDGTELARAQQKGGAAVLLGFKNGGKGDYTLASALLGPFYVEGAINALIDTLIRHVD